MTKSPPGPSPKARHSVRDWAVATSRARQRYAPSGPAKSTLTSPFSTGIRRAPEPSKALAAGLLSTSRTAPGKASGNWAPSLAPALVFPPSSIAPIPPSVRCWSGGRSNTSGATTKSAASGSPRGGSSAIGTSPGRCTTALHRYRPGVSSFKSAPVPSCFSRCGGAPFCERTSSISLMRCGSAPATSMRTPVPEIVVPKGMRSPSSPRCRRLRVVGNGRPIPGSRGWGANSRKAASPASSRLRIAAAANHLRGSNDGSDDIDFHRMIPCTVEPRHNAQWRDAISGTGKSPKRGLHVSKSGHGQQQEFQRGRENLQWKFLSEEVGGRRQRAQMHYKYGSHDRRQWSPPTREHVDHEQRRGRANRANYRRIGGP